LPLPKDRGARLDEREKYVTASVEMLAEGLSRGFSANFVKVSGGAGAAIHGD